MSNDLPIKNDNGNLPEEESERNRRFLILVGIVLLFIVIVLTFGWFYSKEQEEKKAETQRKQQRLAEIDTSIVEISAKKAEIEKTEKIIKVSTRIGVGLLLILGNIIYAHYKIAVYDLDNDISKFLNFNAMIITIYSFVAFVTYGSIDNFVTRLKDILGSLLRRKHLESLQELDSLVKEKEKLLKELQIDNNSTSN